MAVLSYLTAEIAHRWRALRETKDSGYSTETVLIVALLVVLGLGVIAIIAAKVTAKANSIDLGN